MKNLLSTSKSTLVWLAAFVWIIGGIMLFRGGWHLFHQARELQSWVWWHGLIIAAGLILGVIQARTIFTRSCRKNIDRIRLLDDPRLWQFFRPGFFLALAGMITAGVLLDHFARDNYFFMLAVAGLDFALTISLLGSSYVFWVDRGE
jgi:hypothetical protein